MRPRADSGLRRAAGLLLALVLVASQASAWVHAVAISHVACLEHGEAVHGGAVSAAAARLAADSAGGLRADLATAAGHDHCANAALLRWRDVALTAPVALAPRILADCRGSFAPSHDVAHAAAVYLIAPKTSPPRASA